jgi:peptidoglycan hydrolase-like protein with peptidoglycan-binding domain
MTPTADRYKEIQQALTDRGYASGPVDGVWGPEWVNSLKKFQVDQNLDPDGKLGALSLIALGLGPKRQPIGEFPAKPGPDQTP